MTDIRDKSSNKMAGQGNETMQCSVKELMDIDEDYIIEQLK